MRIKHINIGLLGENSEGVKYSTINGIKSCIKMKLNKGESTSGRRGRKESDEAAVTVPL